MNPYSQFVSAFARVVRDAQSLPLGTAAIPRNANPSSDAPRTLIFSPHPDDEVIIGGLPLRLLRESGWNVANVAVTQGSNKARQRERWDELARCCEYVGFGLLSPLVGGLADINPKARMADPVAWKRSVDRIAELIGNQQPRLIFFPHDDDWNVTHIGTHHLVVDALKTLGPRFECVTVETEFWGAMRTPNLMVESSEQDVTDLLTALSFHVGEVRRNPYHIRMPAWLVDNVRRGGELVGGQGGVAPAFQFATLYRLRRWREGGFVEVLKAGKFLAATERPDSMFD